MEVHVKTVITLFTERGDYRPFFVEKTPVDLHRFRADRMKDFPPMQPELSGYQTKKGFRNPDVATFSGSDGTSWVKADTGGVSLFDRPIDMGSVAEYFVLPMGTDLPSGLAISKDSWNERFKAHHHTIHPLFDMPLQRYLGLLRILESRLLRTVRCA